MGQRGTRVSEPQHLKTLHTGHWAVNVGRGHGGLSRGELGSQTSQGTVFIHLFNTHLGRSGIVPGADDTAENQANQASAPRSSDSIQQESQTPDTETLLF